MDLKSVIKALVERYQQKSLFPPMKTRLVKLLYLTELEYFRRTGRRLTSLDWQFYHFGPYARALEPFIGDPDAIAREGFFAEMLSKVQGVPTAQDVDLQHAIVDVVHEWGNADLNTLLDHVYFETEPMQAATRGDFLDFSTVRNEQPESLSLSLDQKKMKQLRDRLQQRAATYAAMRQPTTGPEDLFSNLREWDAENSLDLSPGRCSIDPSKLNFDK
jgi:hypothetical protein